MAYIIYSTPLHAPVARWDGRLADLSLREGEIALPCAAGADPNDPAWHIEAENYDSLYALSNTKADALDRIDRMACGVRAKYITSGAGQEATYLLKEREADAFVAAGRPVETTAYPMLTAEAAATGATVSTLADSVRATRDQWVALAAQVEAIRMGAKAAVALAADVPAVSGIVNQATEQLAFF